VTVLRTECSFDPNPAIPASKFHHGEIGACRHCGGDAKRQKANCQIYLSALGNVRSTPRRAALDPAPMAFTIDIAWIIEMSSGLTR
jgi:hypothetical protein